MHPLDHGRAGFSRKKTGDMAAWPKTGLPMMFKVSPLRTAWKLDHQLRIISFYFKSVRSIDD